MGLHLNKRWRIVAVTVVVVVILMLIVVIFGQRSGAIMYDIDSNEIGHVICYCRGFGPKKLEYLENQRIIDALCHMLSGEYDFVNTWRDTGRDGGGVSKICFYDTAGNEIETVYYKDGFLCVEGRAKGSYYRYQHGENDLSFTALEEAVALNGKSVH